MLLKIKIKNVHIRQKSQKIVYNTSDTKTQVIYLIVAFQLKN